MPTSIATERLPLRPWRASDRAPFAARNADPLVMEWLPAPLSAAESDALEKIGITHEPNRDFEHPRVPDGSHLRRQVRYAIRRPTAAERPPSR